VGKRRDGERAGRIALLHPGAAEVFARTLESSINHMVATREPVKGVVAKSRTVWQNRLVILDSSKGSLRTDAEGNVSVPTNICVLAAAPTTSARRF
jgi:hypothetical protein